MTDTRKFVVLMRIDADRPILEGIKPDGEFGVIRGMGKITAEFIIPGTPENFAIVKRWIDEDMDFELTEIDGRAAIVEKQR